jgi:hypothetical protein
MRRRPTGNESSSSRKRRGRSISSSDLGPSVSVGVWPRRRSELRQRLLPAQLVVGHHARRKSIIDETWDICHATAARRTFSGSRRTASPARCRGPTPAGAVLVGPKASKRWVFPKSSGGALRRLPEGRVLGGAQARQVERRTAHPEAYVREPLPAERRGCSPSGASPGALAPKGDGALKRTSCRITWRVRETR